MKRMKYAYNTVSAPFTTFAAPYGACTYGSETFQDGSCTAAGGSGTSTTTTTTTQGGSPLTNTGFGIALIVGIASLLLLVALVVRFAKRSKPAAVVAADAPAEPVKPAPKKIQL